MKDSICNGTKSVLDLCESIELSCAALYHFFADYFKNDRDSLLLWLKAALEAENRAKQFALVAKLDRHNIIRSIGMELIEAEIVLIYVQSLREKIAAAPPELREALRIALDLEKKLSGCRLEKIVTFSDPSYAKSFVTGDRKHQISLEKAYLRLQEG